MTEDQTNYRCYQLPDQEDSEIKHKVITSGQIQRDSVMRVHASVSAVLSHT